MRPRSAPRAAALALAALIGCEDATAPLPTDGVPDALWVSFHGYGFGAHEVRLRGDTLTIVRRQFFDPRVGVDSTNVVRDAAAWRAFWAAARAARVEDWPTRCTDARIADGGGFELRIVAGGHTWEASGVNAYPAPNGRCTGSADRSPEYTAMMDAVTVLIGRRFP
jgi:hypothetical protein